MPDTNSRVTSGRLGPSIDQGDQRNKIIIINPRVRYRMDFHKGGNVKNVGGRKNIFHLLPFYLFKKTICSSTPLSEVGGIVSTDGQQRSPPLRHGVNEAINHELGYSVPLFQKSSFQFLESLWGWLAASNSSS
ncbi:hypothetical protein TNCV_4653631 [Trichonephila clavipes]|nr:hypothetical protein TNCV_4653631 [Trichonephila clavipes]